MKINYRIKKPSNAIFLKRRPFRYIKYDTDILEDIIWGMSAGASSEACLGHFWDMFGASSGASLGHIWGKISGTVFN